MALELPPGTDLSQVPAGKPPTGVTTVLNPNGPSLENATYGVGGALMVIAAALTLTSVADHLKNLRPNDYTRLVALVLAISYTAVVFSLASHAKHVWDVSLEAELSTKTQKLNFAEVMLLGPATFFAKLSILLLYLHVFKVNRPTRWAIYGAMLLTFLTYWTTFAISPYFCAPHAGQSWTPAILQQCLKTSVWGPIQGTLAVTLDMYILILPLPSVWRLHMARRKKWAMTAVFGVASLGIVAAIVALAYRILAWKYATGDSTWFLGALELCILVEDFVAIIVSAMPQSLGSLRSFRKTEFYVSMNSRIGLFFTRGSQGSRQRNGSGDVELQHRLDEHNVSTKGLVHIHQVDSAVERGM